MRVDGERIYIRVYDVSDAPAVTNAINRSAAELRVWLPWVGEKISLKYEEEFLRQAVEQMRESRAFSFAVFLKHTDELIGGVGTHPIDWANFKTEIGYWMSTAHSGRGYAVEACVLLLEFLFSELKLHRVVASAAEGNTASLRVIEKIGFTFEAVQREAFLIGSVWHNLRSYALLQDEYRAQRQSLYDKFLGGTRPKIRLA